MIRGFETHLVGCFRRSALVRLHPAIAVVASVRRMTAAPAAHALAVAGAQHAAGAPPPAGRVVTHLKRENSNVHQCCQMANSAALRSWAIVLQAWRAKRIQFEKFGYRHLATMFISSHFDSTPR